MPYNVAGGILISAIPLFLIYFGYKLLKQEKLEWSLTLRKFFGLASVSIGLWIMGFIIILSLNSYNV
jgi:hypothetical protein